MAVEGVDEDEVGFGLLPLVLAAAFAAINDTDGRGSLILPVVDDDMIVVRCSCYCVVCEQCPSTVL